MRWCKLHGYHDTEGGSCPHCMQDFLLIGAVILVWCFYLAVR